MLAVPPAILEMLRLQAGAAVHLAVESGRLVIEPASSRRYTMEELLAQCHASSATSQPMSEEDREWTDSAPAGKELI